MLLLNSNMPCPPGRRGGGEAGVARGRGRGEGGGEAGVARPLHIITQSTAHKYQL